MCACAESWRSEMTSPHDVVIAGLGMVPAGEHWEISLRSLATRAILAACKDAPGLVPQALYVGNLLGSVVSHQSNLGALLTEWSGLGGIEGITAEAGEASGAAAFRLGYIAVASGYVDAAMVIGVEKATDQVGGLLEASIAQTLDYDYEGVQGLTPTAQAGMLMQRYLMENKPPREALGAIPVRAHANAVGNPYAVYRKAITLETYAKAPLVADPLNLYDIAPVVDGAAAILLTRAELLPKDYVHKPVRVAGSSVAIDALAVHDRLNPLIFGAAYRSVSEALGMARMQVADVDLLELDDSYSIYAILSLEAAGLAKKGEGWRAAQELTKPMLSMGGMKGRGRPLGAAGVYQLAEAALELRGEAGTCQVANLRSALVQNLGGAAATAITHVLSL
jgi:acetyl-CoA C-acetyltransferase